MDYGTNAGQVQDGWLTRFLKSLRGLPRPMQLSLRNTFRRRARLVMTLITLVLGGMIFMTVGSVRSSLDGLIETGLDYFQFDVQIQFERAVPHPACRAGGAQPARRGHGGGLARRAGHHCAGRRHRRRHAHHDRAPCRQRHGQADPAERALAAPDDQNAIVICQNVLAAEPGLASAATRGGDRRKGIHLAVVGIAQVLGGPPNQIPVYVNYPYFAWLTADVNRASSLQLKLDPASGLTMDEAADDPERSAGGRRLSRGLDLHHRHAAPLHRRLLRHHRLPAAGDGRADCGGGRAGSGRAR